MKKIFALLLCVVMIFGLVSCAAEEPKATATEEQTETKEEVKIKHSALHATDFRGSYVLGDLMPINKKCCFTTVIDTIGDDVYTFDTECEHFYDMNCHNTGCELYKRNQDYCNVCAAAARLAQEVSGFWDKKFAHVR